MLKTDVGLVPGPPLIISFHWRISNPAFFLTSGCSSLVICLINLPVLPWREKREKHCQEISHNEASEVIRFHEAILA